MCCSQYNYCGIGDVYCGEGCKNGFCNVGGIFFVFEFLILGLGWLSFFIEEVFDGWFFFCNVDFYIFECFKVVVFVYLMFGNEGFVDDQK